MPSGVSVSVARDEDKKKLNKDIKQIRAQNSFLMLPLMLAIASWGEKVKRKVDEYTPARGLQLRQN